MQIKRDAVSLSRREKIIHGFVVAAVVLLIIALAGVFYYKNFYNKNSNDADLVSSEYLDQLSEQVTDKIINDLSASALSTMMDKSVAKNLTEQKVNEIFNDYINTSGVELSNNQKEMLVQHVKSTLMGLGLSGDNVFSDVQKKEIATLVSTTVSDSLASDSTRNYLNGVLLDLDTESFKEIVKKDMSSELTTMVGDTTYNFTDDDIETIKNALDLKTCITNILGKDSISSDGTTTGGTSLSDDAISQLEASIIQSLIDNEDIGETPVKGKDYFTQDEIDNIVSNASTNAVTLMSDSITDLNTSVSTNAADISTLNQSYLDTNTSLAKSNTELSTAIKDVNTALDDLKTASEKDNKDAVEKAEKALKEKAEELGKLIDSVNESDLNDVEKATAKSYADDVADILDSYKTSNDSSVQTIMDTIGETTSTLTLWQSIDNNKDAIDAMTTDVWIEPFTIPSSYFNDESLDSATGCYVYTVEDESLTEYSDVCIDYANTEGFSVFRYEQGDGFLKIYFSNPTVNISIRQIHIQNKPVATE